MDDLTTALIRREMRVVVWLEMCGINKMQMCGAARFPNPYIRDTVTISQPQGLVHTGDKIDFHSVDFVEVDRIDRVDRAVDFVDSTLLDKIDKV